jgi:two-component system NtrC family sensor kinase
MLKMGPVNWCKNLKEARMSEYDNISVMVADDEIPFLEMMEKYLKKKGMTVVTARSGKESLQKLAHGDEMDVVVMDINMPGMSGLEALARIQFEFPMLEVILITGRATVESAVEGLRRGAYDYLVKPFKLDLFLEKLRGAKRRKEDHEQQIFEMASNRFDALGKLAAGVAHEINNPLAVIVERAGLMEDLIKFENFRVPETINEFRESLKHIKTQAHRCKTITHRLLSLASVRESSLCEIDINFFVNKVATLFEWEAYCRKIFIEKRLDPKLPRVFMSDSELQLLLVNLIDNAIESIGFKGWITLTTKLIEKSVLLDVEDTGRGIPEDYLSRVFNPFFKIDPSSHGVGLGLSVCQGIVTRMGGVITVESTVGKGTTFHISFPVTNQNA